ncbi:MAG: glutamine--fructose-6-phosphate transaminase (isomerizing) [Oligoflexales bacterium]|nr:glutamine--fructose-6-phosphate transaminase (isomerizing) [Oligoflexales bacterium]
MCGVMGYVGGTPCVSLIYEGLKKLEYRGYDSAGMAVLDCGKVSMVKSEGKLARLEPLLSSLPRNSPIGMGHTRWATHGEPSTKNAHPHMEQGVVIIHNGIIENYREFKIDLLQKGTQFLSETDSEVIVHLLLRELKVVPDVRKSLLNLLPQFKGAYALGIMSMEDPDAIYLVKQGCPMVVGVGENENFFASDALALAPHTKKMLFLEDGEIARISKKEISIWNFNGAEIHRDPVFIEYAETAADKGGYRHFMMKEIQEQSGVIARTFERLKGKGSPSSSGPLQASDAGHLNFKELGLDAIDCHSWDRILITACGTAYYAGVVGKYLIEPWVDVPVECELASELRYRAPFLNSRTLLIAITQSGETADTLACVKMAKTRGAQVLAICNVPYSSIPREASSTLYMEAGPELGVASTKAFTSMIFNLYYLALGLYQKRGPKPYQASLVAETLERLRRLPLQIDQVLQQEAAIEKIARKYFEVPNCLFLGRGLSFPIALEGALKLKEISYIHAEAYAGGELKHGPIALIDKAMPVVVVAPLDKFYDKMISNVEEICARGGKILGVGSKSDQKLRALSEEFIPCPDAEDELSQAVLSVVTLQLFSYYMALHRGTDVDQPRNLAKSVTVE